MSPLSLTKKAVKGIQEEDEDELSRNELEEKAKETKESVRLTGSLRLCSGESNLNFVPSVDSKKRESSVERDPDGDVEAD